MTDLISRQAALDVLWRLHILQQMQDDTHSADKVMLGIYLSKKRIEELPYVDAVPVRRGKWIIRETAFEDTEAKCSECGFKTLVNQPGNGLLMVSELLYCPNCGARMDGKDGDDGKTD